VTSDSEGRPQRKEARVGLPEKYPSEFRREAIALVKSSRSQRARGLCRHGRTRYVPELREQARLTVGQI
jgi:hypothetical protein